MENICRFAHAKYYPNPCPERKFRHQLKYFYIFHISTFWALGVESPPEGPYWCLVAERYDKGKHVPAPMPDIDSMPSVEQLDSMPFEQKIVQPTAKRKRKATKVKSPVEWSI